MRRIGLIAVCCACASTDASGVAGIVLDVPNGALDPRDFTQVDIVLRARDRDTIRRSARLDAGASAVALDAIDLPASGAAFSVEATLRNASGAVMGYGRTAAGEAFRPGAEIAVPVRRPIAYVTGLVSADVDGDPGTNDLHWSAVPATFADLSLGAPLDGSTRVGDAARAGDAAVLAVAAGPDLYFVHQAPSDPSGELVGAATITPIAAADHRVGAALPGALSGAVLDGAGAADGSVLAIGTASQLYGVELTGGTVTALAAGNFARVAVVTSDTGSSSVIAIANRSASTAPCAGTAELWWSALPGGPAQRIAIGDFSDVAADRGRAYYIDPCASALGEIVASPGAGPAFVLRPLRKLDGRPTALAVSSEMAYLGVETPPATIALIVVSTAGDDPPRVLWSERAQQVLDARALDGVQRLLGASAVAFGQLEVGAGGAYVALTTAAHFFGAAVPSANFPEIAIDTEELRVFDGATGGVVQRYRSWCSGTLVTNSSNDIVNWACASTAGQTAPGASGLGHHLRSMAFLFGKK